MADLAENISVVIDDADNSVRVDPVTGTIERDTPDGGVVVNLDARRPGEQGASKDFYANLVDDIDPQTLARIGQELFDAISADDRSRSEYLDIRARGLDLLGIKIQEPRAGIGEASGAVEGMSSVTNPLLLEAILKGWANAQAELLPAAGPLKIRDDGDETPQEDELADRLQRDANHYLTKTASEYYPDTSHMLLWGVYFGGSGIKKVYRCPLRKRPVSESVDAKDFIVSDTTKDLRSCGRITHQIPMRPSVMKRMQMIGAYRDVTLTQPTPSPDQVAEKIAGIQGTQPQMERPEDQPYTLWESQCELDLPDFGPKEFSDAGVPLPYLVTIDKDSREILAIRRDWNEDDTDCQRKRMYVKYPYVPGPGFYGTGMLNILGNSSAAMTAAWREALDAGMFASFPGGLIAKHATRQNSSVFRVAPGTFEPVDTGQQPIGNVVMGMPYRDVTPGLLGMMDKVTQQSKPLSGAAEIPVGEGLQNVPVGTMLANIEQATKIMAAAHKGMHTAQSEEFDLLFDLFRENPEDFWRGNRDCPQAFWTAEKFVQALDSCKLVPVSDPNVPSYIHRISIALALIQLKNDPGVGKLLDAKAVLLHCLRALRVDPNGLVVDPAPQQAPVDLQGVGKIMDAQAKQQGNQVKLVDIQNRGQQKMAELDAKKDIETVQLAQALVIHQDDAAKTRASEQRATLESERAHQMGLREHGLEAAKAAHDAALETHQALNPPQPAKPKAKT